MKNPLKHKDESPTYEPAKPFKEAPPPEPPKLDVRLALTNLRNEVVEHMSEGQIYEWKKRFDKILAEVKA